MSMFFEFAIRSMYHIYNAAMGEVNQTEKKSAGLSLSKACTRQVWRGQEVLAPPYGLLADRPMGITSWQRGRMMQNSNLALSVCGVPKM